MATLRFWWMGKTKTLTRYTENSCFAPWRVTLIRPNGKDGGNIDHVDLFIYDDDHIVYKHTESTVKYCAFSGGDNGGKCNTFVFCPYTITARQRDWKFSMGRYTLRGYGGPKDGRKKNAAPVIIKVFSK